MTLTEIKEFQKKNPSWPCTGCKHTARDHDNYLDGGAFGLIVDCNKRFCFCISYWPKSNLEYLEQKYNRSTVSV